MIPLANFKNFSEAGQAVLKFLAEHLPLKFWMITRTESNDCIILQTHNDGYEIKSGSSLPWQDSFCFQMIEEGAPKIAPSSSDIPLYKNAPINKVLKIQSYIGEPILQQDGSLFGTLCGIDPYPQSEELNKAASLIELLGKLLSNILQAELREQEQLRKSERLQMEAATDYLTQIFNRRAWDDLVTLEEIRCKKYAHPTTAVIIDLNDLKQINDQSGHDVGDQLIQKTAHILKSCVRNQDIVARLGGDEFGILLIETNSTECAIVVERIIAALEKENINASIGYAMRDPLYDLTHAIKQADLNMYQHKKQTKKKNPKNAYHV